MSVAGVGAYRGGWVGVELDEAGFRRAFQASDFEAVLKDCVDAEVIGVDIPIGFPSSGRRRADREAAAFVGSRRSSVFPIPPRPALEAPTFAEAVALAREFTDIGISQQAYTLALQDLRRRQVGRQQRPDP